MTLDERRGSPMNLLNNPKYPPKTLRVVIRDDGPMVFCGDSPTFRSVAIQLTDEQRRQVELRCVGRNCDNDIYESVSRVFFDEE